MILHKKQREIIQSPARFKVIRAGRRSGKTVLQVEQMVFTAVSGKDRNVFYISPTQKQSRSIVWEALKKRVGKIGEANEGRLEMKLPTNDGGTSIIYLSGWENRENFRGLKAELIVFDELDTMRNFFIGWQEIFRPSLMDTGGNATFIGTPKKENPNLRRLEKEASDDWGCFKFTTLDNPFVPDEEKEIAKKELDPQTYKQEILAEYLENQGSLFKYDALVDMFSNAVDKGERFLIVDIADDGTDKTVFSFWNGLEEYRREAYKRLNTEGIINQIREYATQERIPYSHIAVDAIGVGAGVASSSLLDGIVGYKSSYSAIKTDQDIVRLPNVSYTKNAPLVTDYRNLRSQCVFTLAGLVNNHKIASRVDGIQKENTIEELSIYQDASKGDGKRMATQKEDVKELIGRSTDESDCFIMRMFFEIKGKSLQEHEDTSQKELLKVAKENILNETNK
ncbi:MAG: terminase family protein [candidate division WOR-3 bacterium]|nr:terminase family protein [candidate division WOR-3 bacterium]